MNNPTPGENNKPKTFSKTFFSYPRILPAVGSPEPEDPHANDLIFNSIAYDEISGIINIKKVFYFI